MKKDFWCSDKEAGKRWENGEISDRAYELILAHNYLLRNKKDVS